ncbi:uncharacterized protein LOC119440972 [Dermacentor silvarum]|uniref:uncharacterized protein LOC119440972 n=1 Tax=Dermacentor silvarum TaxID=543639 RepID=UPI002100F1CA|nr:uncharacterized protein LOC119440972 [Dermacentor silvarum]
MRDNLSAVITAGKAAKLGSKILQHCMTYTVMRYGLPPNLCQRGLKAICTYIRFCFKKYAEMRAKNKKQYSEIMTDCVVKNTIMALSRFSSSYRGKDLQDAMGLLIDGRKCLLKNNLIPDTVDVALQIDLEGA